MRTHEMPTDLTFVKSRLHRRLLEELLEQLSRDDAIIGAMLLGFAAVELIDWIIAHFEGDMYER
jgi:hypothetical protein